MITVVSALMSEPNKYHMRLVRFLSIMFRKEPLMLISSVPFYVLPKSFKYHIKPVSDRLFDFSRYNELIADVEDEAVVVAFNDTLGNGRRFGFGLVFFLYLSIIKIRQGSFIIAGPVDSDEHGEWLCPYFFVGKAKNLKVLVWDDYPAVRSQIPPKLKKKLHAWINFGWRNANSASKKQAFTKLKTLYLERTLVDFSRTPVYRFNRRSLLRAINRFI